MRKYLLSLVVAVFLFGSASTVSAANYVEYYRDNLFLGIAYHRVGCLTNYYNIQSSQDYDGFTNNRYCFAGDPWYGPHSRGATWFDWNYASGKSQLDSCGNSANSKYGTYNYKSSSSTCGYNIWCDCNSDCWIKKFSKSQGWRVSIVSPCCSSWWCGCF